MMSLKKRASAPGRARQHTAAAAPVVHWSSLTGEFIQRREVVLPSHWKAKRSVPSPFQAAFPQRLRLVRALALLLIIGLNVFNFTSVRYTGAMFLDAEASPENAFEAAQLGIALTEHEHEAFLGPATGEDVEFGTLVTLQEDSIPVVYRAFAQSHSGDDAYCGALELEAEHDGFEYEGTLIDFAVPTTTVFGSWEFEAELASNFSEAPHGAVCGVEIVFEAWRSGVEMASTSGFFDRDIFQVQFSHRAVVLNEFLPRPQGEAYGFDFGNDASDMPQGEWVELFNNSDFPQDVSGWYLWDASGGEGNKVPITADNTSPAGTVIAPHSWLVVYLNKPVLNNGGDTVRLFDASGALVDAYEYKGHDVCSHEPTAGQENETTTGGSSCPSIPPNKSYARLPDGVGSWVDPVPTPGFSNTAERPVIEPTPNSLSVEATSPSQQARAPLPEIDQGAGKGESAATSTPESALNSQSVVPATETQTATTTDAQTYENETSAASTTPETPPEPEPKPDPQQDEHGPDEKPAQDEAEFPAIKDNGGEEGEGSAPVEMLSDETPAREERAEVPDVTDKADELDEEDDTAHESQEPESEPKPEPQQETDEPPVPTSPLL